jgi:surface-anchored protein
MIARSIPGSPRRLVALIMILAAWPAQAIALEQFTAGHADMAVYNSGTNLQLRYNFASSATVNGAPVGGTGRIADPALIETVIPNSSTILIPDDSAYSPYWRNRTTWYLPPNNNPGVPDLGIGKEIASGIFTGNVVTLFLDSIVSRPTGGEFMLISSAGVPVFMDTANPSSPNQLVIPVHDHYYWAFSQVGTYQLNFRAEATILTSGLPTSTISTFTFTVVPEPSTWVLAGAGVVVAGFAARRKTRNRP